MTARYDELQEAEIPLTVSATHAPSVPAYQPGASPLSAGLLVGMCQEPQT